MKSFDHIAMFDTTVRKAHEWLEELEAIGGYSDQGQAMKALRAVLHTLRDRLNADEAVDLAAEMPVILRGVYYEGWKPGRKHPKSAHAFVDHVRHELRGSEEIDTQDAVAAVFVLLEGRISAGEIGDVRGCLPADIRALWPQGDNGE